MPLLLPLVLRWVPRSLCIHVARVVLAAGKIAEGEHAYTVALVNPQGEPIGITATRHFKVRSTVFTLHCSGSGGMCMWSRQRSGASRDAPHLRLLHVVSGL